MPFAFFGKQRLDILQHSDRKQVKIRGIIVPSEWDEKGTVISISLSTFDEDEYLIEKDEKGGQLLLLIREEVEVRGIVREEDGNKIIRIKKYHLNNA